MKFLFAIDQATYDVVICEENGNVARVAVPSFIDRTERLMTLCFLNIQFLGACVCVLCKKISEQGCAKHKAVWRDTRQRCTRHTQTFIRAWAETFIRACAETYEKLDRDLHATHTPRIRI
jgi:hypothetical protein